MEEESAALVSFLGAVASCSQEAQAIDNPNDRWNNLDIDLTLSILKYAGIPVAAVSSIWSATHVTSREVNGRKQVTRAGRVSIAITLAGLTISVASAVLQDFRDAAAAKARASAELQRTNKIILAGQPLANLELRWSFGYSKEAAQYVRDLQETASEYQADNSQGPVSSSQGYSLDRKMVFHPFLCALATGVLGRPCQSVVVLTALDEYQNSVLSFGELSSSVTWNGKKRTKSVDYALSGGVSYTEDLGAEWHGYSPNRDRVARSGPYVQLNSESDSLKLWWSLDPETLLNSIDKQNPAITLTANLPQRLRLLIVYEMKDLPFESGNFARSPNSDPWSESAYTSEQLNGSARVSPLIMNSSLDLVPNGLTDQSVRYQLRQVRVAQGVDNEYGEEIQCQFLVIVFERTETTPNQDNNRPKGLK